MAKKGWVKDRGKWYYYDTNGSMKKGWIKDKEKWYYLLDNGEMVANRWLQDPKNSKWYFFRSNGEMLVSDWAQDSAGKWYYLRSNGEMALSQMRKGKDGNNYYLGSDGAMATRGEINWAGNWYYVKRSGVCGIIKNIVTKRNLLDLNWREKLLTDNMLLKLNAALSEYSIIDKNSLRHFLAQCCVESGCGEILLEKHSSKFTSPQEYFRSRDFKEYNNVPGSPAMEDDGAKYRGAGYIQKTWKDAYYKFAKYIGDDEILNRGCEYVAANYAWESAGWFWSVFKKLNSLIENEPDITVDRVTKIVNGGYTALEKRIEVYNRSCDVI